MPLAHGASSHFSTAYDASVKICLFVEGVCLVPPGLHWGRWPTRPKMVVVAAGILLVTCGCA